MVTSCGAQTEGEGGGSSHLADGGALPPLPDIDAGLRRCEEYDAGTAASAGPCCPEVACFTPDPPGACPDGDYSLTSVLFPERSFGSGECMCDVSGPFAGGSRDACCYVASIQWCTGRTLWVGGTALLAPLVAERWT